MKARVRTFYVTFLHKGEIEPRVIHYRDTSIVGAFEKTQRRFPDAKLIEGWTESFYEAERVHQVHTAIHHSNCGRTRAQMGTDRVQLFRRNFFPPEQKSQRDGGDSDTPAVAKN